MDQIPNIKFTPEELEIIRINSKKYSVLGQLPGPSPPYRKFQEWCRLTLHTSMTACELLGNGFFQVLFSSKDGTSHALSGIHVFQGREVPFTFWRPGFSAQNPASAALLDYPIWLYFSGLSLCLRNEECFRIFGSKVGQVLYYVDTDKYFDTTIGPRVKVLVKATTVIPNAIEIPGSSSGVYHKHEILTSGHPFYCATCCTWLHNLRDCPQTSGRGEQRHSPHTRETRGTQGHRDAKVAENSPSRPLVQLVSSDGRVLELQRSCRCQSSSNPFVISTFRGFPWVVLVERCSCGPALVHFLPS